MMTRTELLAATTEELEEANYQRVRIEDAPWDESNGRAFEDQFGVVGVFVFETWENLKRTWPDAQGLLVELISSHLPRHRPKAWEGYLVLLTPGQPPSDERRLVDHIRYDTNRVRKVVATGDSLTSVGDVRQALLPLLPVEPRPPELELEDPLPLLPEILASHGVSDFVAEALVHAFVEGRLLMEAIHTAIREVPNEGTVD